MQNKHKNQQHSYKLIILKIRKTKSYTIASKIKYSVINLNKNVEIPTMKIGSP